MFLPEDVLRLRMFLHILFIFFTELLGSCRPFELLKSIACLGAAELSQVDLEEMKLALGLRIQHAARAGMDGDGAGWDLMQDGKGSPSMKDIPFKAITLGAKKFEGNQRKRNDLQKEKGTASGFDANLCRGFGGHGSLQIRRLRRGKALEGGASWFTST